MASILFVSKPVAPPWNDSGKNLVRDLARGLTRHQATLMVRVGSDPDVQSAEQAIVYPANAGGFAPALLDQGRVFGHLLGSSGHALWHFFFAPNPKSCLAGGLSTKIRGKRSVHTISSAPRDPVAIAPRLFADINVVLSAHTEKRMLEAGVSQDRLVRIAPAIEPLTPMRDDERARVRKELGLPVDAPVVVYPGDLEFGEGGQVMVDAQRALATRGVHLVMACRAKTEGAKQAERALRECANEFGLLPTMTWLGETAHIHALLAAADIVALPSKDLYAKMDYPLVLLEAMSLARPVIVARGSAAEEITEGGAAIALDPSGDAAAAEIARLLDDQAALRTLGERGKTRVRERYSYPVMARAYEDVYDRLL